LKHAFQSDMKYDECLKKFQNYLGCSYGESLFKHQDYHGIVKGQIIKISYRWRPSINHTPATFKGELVKDEDRTTFIGQFKSDIFAAYILPITLFLISCKIFIGNDSIYILPIIILFLILNNLLCNVFRKKEQIKIIEFIDYIMDVNR
jgi:hypothetical protein